MTRILVVDDHPLAREGMCLVLGGEPDFELVGQADGKETSLVLADRERPDVVVLDLRLSDADGIEVAAELLELIPGLGIVMFTAYPDLSVQARAAAAGAKGLVSKSSEPEVLRKAVRLVAGGATYFPPDPVVAEGPDDWQGPCGLTRQEMRVIRLLPQGLTNQGIADRLGLSIDQVKGHLTGARVKLSARGRAHIAAMVVEREWGSPPETVG